MYSLRTVSVQCVYGGKCTFAAGSADDHNSSIQHAKYLKFSLTINFNKIILCCKYEEIVTMKITKKLLAMNIINVTVLPP